MSDNQKIPHWDKEEVWNAIEDSLNEKERKRRPFWWFWSGLLMLFAFLVLVKYISFSADPEHTESIVVSHKTEIQQPVKRISPIEVDDDLKSNTLATKTTTIRTTTTTTDITSAVVADQPAISTSPVSNQSLNVITRNYQRSTGYESINHPERIKSANTMSKPRSSAKSGDGEMESRDSIDVFSIQAIETIAPIFLSKYHRGLDLTITPILMPDDPLSPYDLQFSYHAGKLTRSLSGAENYLNAKEQYESPQESQMFNIVLRRKWNGFSIGSGLSLERSTTMFNYSSKELIRTYKILSDSTYVSKNSGSLSYLSGERVVKEYNIQSIKSPRRYYSLSIPIQLSYAIEHLKTDVSLSYYWNVWNAHTGYYLDENLVLIHKDDKAAIRRLYPRRVNRIGIGLTSRLYTSETLDLTVSGNYLYDTRSHQVSIEERLRTLYLGVGATWKW